VLQRVAACCSVLQCVAVCCSSTYSRERELTFGECCSVLQCVAVCCSVLQCVAVCCSVLQCAAVCCSVLQCAAVCCSVLQRVAVCYSVLCTAPASTIKHFHPVENCIFKSQLYGDFLQCLCRGELTIENFCKYQKGRAPLFC